MIHHTICSQHYTECIHVASIHFGLGYHCCNAQQELLAVHFPCLLSKSGKSYDLSLFLEGQGLLQWKVAPLEGQEEGAMGVIERKKHEISCKSRAKDWDKA